MRPRRVRTAAALCALSAILLAAAQPDDDDDAPAPPGTAARMSPIPFLMNVRYGRSSPDARPRHMEPRADRFFMGSRYGKRSPVPVPVGGVGEVETTLVCRHTGVKTLYRCYRTHERRRRRRDLSREEAPSPRTRR